jgi:hypothetical protein
LVLFGTSALRSRALPTSPPHWNLALTHHASVFVLSEGKPSYASPVKTGSSATSGVEGVEADDARFPSSARAFEDSSALSFAAPTWMPYLRSCSCSIAAMRASLPLARPQFPQESFARSFAKSRSLFLPEYRMPSRPFSAPTETSALPFASTAHEARFLAVSSSSESLSLSDAESESACAATALANLSAADSKWPSHHFSSHLYRKASSAPSPCCNSRFFTFRASDMPCLFLPRPSPSDQPILLSMALPYPLYAFSFGAVSKLGIFMATRKSAATPRPRYAPRSASPVARDVPRPSPAPRIRNRRRT